MSTARVVPSIRYIGPVTEHDITCWFCEDRPAVYFTPEFCFRPCWECQTMIRKQRTIGERIAHWIAGLLGIHS